MRKIILTLAALLALTTPALAQSCPAPTFYYGWVPTAAQWNQEFACKQNVLGYTPVNKAGDTMSGKLTLVQPSSLTASLNIPQGVIGPSAPVNGDMWLTAAGLNLQLSGGTVGPFNTPIYTGASAPGVPNSYSFWNNTAGATVPFNIFDGSQWVNIGTLNPATHTWTAASGGSVTSIAGTANEITASSSTGAVTLSLPSALTFTGKTVTNGTFANPILTTPTLGVATATTINKVTITAPASGSTLTIANGKTLTASNTLTLAGTDSTVLTFPSTSATIARTDAGQTFTGTNAFGSLTSADHVVTSASATAFAAGLAGTTNPAFSVDASTASSATGIKVKSAAAAGGVAVSVTSSGTNENLTVDAKGSGTITLGGTSTGGIVLSRSTTLGTITGTANSCLQANSSGVVSGTGTPCAGAQSWTQTAFTGSGTFTTPVGSTTSTIYHFKLWAGGGGSAGNAIGDGNYGTEGAGGGQYCEGTFTGVAASTGITVTIGAGGTAGTNAPTAGGNGGNTTLGSPVSITCHGGTGGRVATSSVFFGAAGGTGASGAAIDINGYNGTGTASEGGLGGGSPMGGGIGGKWLQSTASNAWSGQGFGAGAGGSRATGGFAAAGAAGTAGYALIERVAN